MTDASGESEGSRTAIPVTIVHDRQNGLTDDKVASMRRLSGLTDLRFRASSADPRIQIADFVAGVARKIAEDALQGRGDPSLTALLRPYVDPASVWADQGSWSMLDPAGSTGSGPTVGSGAAAS